IGEAIVLPQGALAGFTEDKRNHLVLVKAQSGKPVKYLIGAGWTKSGDFASKQDWEAYVTSYAQRLASPVKVSVSN
ncbi:MAG TPA: DUF4861 family protein, partial [Opitutaceae bacterium]|nr:DUF4861 family protein [Opitutaceae bacterium]